MTGKGSMTDKDFKAAFNSFKDDFTTALDEIKAELNSEETQAAFRDMAEEIRRMDLLSELKDLDFSLPDQDLSPKHLDFLGGAQDDTKQ